MSDCTFKRIPSGSVVWCKRHKQDASSCLERQLDEWKRRAEFAEEKSRLVLEESAARLLYADGLAVQVEAMREALLSVSDFEIVSEPSVNCWCGSMEGHINREWCVKANDAMNLKPQKAGQLAEARKRLQDAVFAACDGCLGDGQHGPHCPRAYESIEFACMSLLSLGEKARKS